MTTEEALNKLEKEIKTLQEELEVCNEAKPASETCDALCEYTQKGDEPFSTSSGPNEWHKSAGGGGGCAIL
jgi:hypothetical protein